MKSNLVRYHTRYMNVNTTEYFVPYIVIRYLRERVRQDIYRFCRQKELVEVEELSVQADHIHLCKMTYELEAIFGH